MRQKQRHVLGRLGNKEVTYRLVNVDKTWIVYDTFDVATSTRALKKAVFRAASKKFSGVNHSYKPWEIK